MFTLEKRIVFVLPLLGLLACTRSHQDFNQAVEKSRALGLLEVQPSHPGVPFYAQRTLDPVWDEKSPIVKIDSIHLEDQEGSKRDEHLFDDKITLITFFYTSCSGFCPTLIKSLQDIEKQLSGAKSIQYVAISVDPEVDRPAKLKDYSKRMHLDHRHWTLLTGDRAIIYQLAGETFAAEVIRLPKSKGQVAHSEHFFVIDGQRRLRGILKGTRTDVAASAQSLISALGEKTESR